MTTKTETMIKNEQDILALAGETYFKRGLGYFNSGAVEDLLETKGIVKAIVSGTYDYHVSFGMHGKRFDYDCDCPVGQDGEFCKHLVAAALEWLEQKEHTDTSAPANNKTKLKPAKKTDPIKTIKDYLHTSTKAQLISLITGQAENDPALRTQTVTDVESQKAFIRNAIHTNGFIDYHGMRHYTPKVWPAVELLEALLKDGHAAPAAELAEYALTLGFTAYGNVDDSDGNLGQILNDIAQLHHAACTKSKPAPQQLAETLFTLEQKDDWGLVHFEQYNKLLGKDGLQHFKQLAQNQWQKVPAKQTKDENISKFGEHFGITRLMERIAKLEGDVESLVAVKTRDLSKPYYYCEIATTYANAKRHDDALKWAEEGYNKFKNDQDPRLNAFLISEYQRRKQHGKALDIAWRQWTGRPGLEDYQQLKSCADKTKTWNAWREKALHWLRHDYLPQLNTQNQHWKKTAAQSLLVGIPLWEKDTGTALREAKQHGCTEHLWMQLARACEKTRPAEAVKIYQDHIGGIIGQTNNRAYDQAAIMLTTIKNLMHTLKQQQQFGQYIEQLRRDHKQKRNFIKRIEKI